MMHSDALKQIESLVHSLKGDIAEVGVYQGMSAQQILEAFPARIVHLFDTFDGLPEFNPSVDAHHKREDYSDTSLEDVQNLLRRYSNVRFYKGVFPETAFHVNDQSFCFVNIDVNLYSSTKAALDFFYPRLVRGGILLIQDDYGVVTAQGATKAVDEFCEEFCNEMSRLPGNGVYFVKEH